MTSTRVIQRYHSGSLPFAVDVFLGTYEGPAWVRQKLRGKSGWMQLSRARMTTPISSWTATLIAARTEDGENLGTVTSSAFLSMRSSGPRELIEVPPDDLDTQSEMLFWDFLGRCDLRHLGMLREGEADAAERIAREQARGEKVLAQADDYIADLRRRRRALASDDPQRDRLAQTIAMFEEKQAAAAAWLVRRLARIREDLTGLEEEVFAALEHHGEIEELYTVHWTARHPADRIYSRERADAFFQGPNRPRPRNRTALARLAWDRQYDDESDEQRRWRLDVLRDERRRDWTRRMVKRAVAEAERREKQKELDREFAVWEEEQRRRRLFDTRLRLTVEAAKDLTASAAVTRRLRLRRAGHSPPAHVQSAAAPVRTGIADRTVPDDAAAMEMLEGAVQARADADPHDAWMREVGLV